MKEKIALISILANFFLSFFKILVAFISGSGAVLAEGLHSTMDIFSSFISYLGIKASKKPVDKKHPYGHYKFEVLSGLFITLILFSTGIYIFYEAYKKFLNPTPLNYTYLALGVMLFSALLNEIMARLKIKYGKKESSISLLSDGIHSRIDVYSSLAIFVGIFFIRYLPNIDSLLMVIIALYIIKESFSIGKEAIDSLLDVSAGEEIENKIKNIVKEQGISLAELKTQKKGSAITANLKINLPKNLKVEEATNISNYLREKLMSSIENLKYVAIQIQTHNLSTNYLKPYSIGNMKIGRGFGWQRKGRFMQELPQAKGLGPEGYCVCPKCGYKIKHERGIPCLTLRCPKCNIPLIRK